MYLLTIYTVVFHYIITDLLQQQDLVGIGQLLVGVALQSPTATQPENFHQSLEYLTSHFSPDLHHIVQYSETSEQGTFKLSFIQRCPYVQRGLT